MTVRFFKMATVCCSMMVFVSLVLTSVVTAQQWYVELYSENHDYIEVTVDTRNIPTNTYLDEVTFEVTFYDSQNKPTKQLFKFTGEQLLFSTNSQFSENLDHRRIPEDLRQVFENKGISLSNNATVSFEGKSDKWLIRDRKNRKTYFIRLEENRLYIYDVLQFLKPGFVYVRYFRHSYGAAQSLKGGYIYYKQGVGGGKPDNANQKEEHKRKESGKRIQTNRNFQKITGSVPQPKFSPFDFNGGYRMVHDGWKGTLNINYPKAKYIGTRGKRFSVKLHIKEHHIIFYIVGMSGENMDNTGGQKFDGYMMTQTKDAIAGITWWHGRPFGFYATRITSPVPRSKPSPQGMNFSGSYHMVHDGWKGTLNINYPKAEYIAFDGRKFPVKLRVREHHVTFYIIGMSGENVDNTGGQKFDGYMMTQTKDAIAGITWWHGRPFGFYAIRK